MIPKIFHQIWINKTSPELPEKFRAYRNGWLALHPDWKYKLWNFDNLDFTPRRIDLVSTAPSYAQMADVLSYEVLLRHGDVYLDTDFECLRNIDPKLISVKSFSCSEDGYSITNAIIGAEPNSIYMDRCVNALRGGYCYAWWRRALRAMRVDWLVTRQIGRIFGVAWHASGGAEELMP
jgi:inositol phosphorylceramide mannosyltransferase catalytic subunit